MFKQFLTKMNDSQSHQNSRFPSIETDHGIGAWGEMDDESGIA